MYTTETNRMYNDLSGIMKGLDLSYNTTDDIELIKMEQTLHAMRCIVSKVERNELPQNYLDNWSI
jgi:hypothetical protein